MDSCNTLFKQLYTQLARVCPPVPGGGLGVRPINLVLFGLIESQRQYLTWVSRNVVVGLVWDPALASFTHAATNPSFTIPKES